jgi:quinol monooxygenase YgiN
LNYDLHLALDNPALFLFHENWISEAHLEQHLQKPDLKAVLATLEQLVADPPQITLWKKIG